MSANDNKDDPMVRDGKKLAHSNTLMTVPSFLLHLLIVLPIWLFVLVPIAMLQRLFATIARVVCGPCMGKKQRADKSDKAPLNPPAEEEKNVAGMAVSAGETARTYDIVIFGATGFTGNMAVQYLASKYGNDGKIKWAIAGRRQGGLEKIRSELGVGFEELPIVIADSSDVASLTSMVLSTKVILTTTGPFAKYGTELVRVCAQHGTHYADITGETDWVRSTIDQFDDLARSSGARIVHFAGHDCVPWDLSVLAVAEHLKKEHNDTLKSVTCYDEILAEASGGTMATLFHSLANRVPYRSNCGFDPLQKMQNGEKSTAKFRVRNQGFKLSFAKEANAWVGPFMMAPVMANCVRRSNAVNQYGSEVTYREANVYAGFMAGFISILDIFVLGTCLSVPAFKWVMLATGIVPSPGQGPSKAGMDAGFLKVTTFATGEAGSKAKATIYFPTDPGYRDTARMLVESGLVLALQLDETINGPGVHTPATCLGMPLMQRLVSSGSSFNIE